MDRATAKLYIEETCGRGWLHLVDDIFDNAPEGVVIGQVFQKYGHLHVSYDGYHEKFERYLLEMEDISAHVCERCGEPGEEKLHGGWSTARCPRHALLPRY